MQSSHNHSNSNNVVPKRRVLGSSTTTTTVPPLAPNKVHSSDSLSEMSLSDSSSLSLTSLDMLSPLGLQDDTELFCPICNERMLRLSQLNRHLDDEHSSDKPVKQLDEDIKTWFKKKVISRASDVINDRKNLVKLDLFDNDRNFTFSTVNDSSSNLNELNKIKMDIPNTHWKKLVGNDICHYGSCNKYLNIKNGTVNCRKCGYLFCNEHTFFKIKINDKLEYDLDGVLVRCCHDCFIGKPHYNDTGYVRDLSLQFRQKRLTKTDERDLELNRLERRLIKFYDYFQLIELNQKVMNYKKFENSVVNWQLDSEIHNCFICDNKFSILTMLRKHHCRLCGRVVCGDLETQCSMEVPIGVLMQYLVMNTDESKKYPPLQKNSHRTIRCCHDCKKIMFDKKLFNKDLKSPKPEILRIYETILIYKHKIESLLPDFKESMNMLTDTNTEKTSMGNLINEHQKIRNLSKDRVKLKELFKKLDLILKRLHHKLNKDELELKLSADELRLEKSIYIAGVTFLQENMSKLQDVSEPEQTPKPIQPKISKREIRINREKLMVLKEQKFLVEEMIANCKKKRKFDDLKSLEFNLKDLNNEINEIDSTLGDEFGFE